jgi:hypothetical protein
MWTLGSILCFSFGPGAGGIHDMLWFGVLALPAFGSLLWLGMVTFRVFRARGPRTSIAALSLLTLVAAAYLCYVLLAMLSDLQNPAQNAL